MKLDNVSVTEIRYSVSTGTAAAGTLACLAAAQYGPDLLRRPAVRQLLIQRRVPVALREPLLHDGWLPQEESPIDAGLGSLFQQLCPAEKLRHRHAFLLRHVYFRPLARALPLPRWCPVRCITATQWPPAASERPDG